MMLIELPDGSWVDAQSVITLTVRKRLLKDKDHFDLIVDIRLSNVAVRHIEFEYESVDVPRRAAIAIAYEINSTLKKLNKSHK